MKQYEVDCKVFGYMTIKVDANNVDEAIRIANEVIKTKDNYELDTVEFNLYYCGTNDRKEECWY